MAAGRLVWGSGGRAARGVLIILDVSTSLRILGTLRHCLFFSKDNVSENFRSQGLNLDGPQAPNTVFSKFRLFRVFCWLVFTHMTVISDPVLNLTPLSF